MLDRRIEQLLHNLISGPGNREERWRHSQLDIPTKVTTAKAFGNRDLKSGEKLKAQKEIKQTDKPRPLVPCKLALPAQHTKEPLNRRPF